MIALIEPLKYILEKYGVLTVLVLAYVYMQYRMQETLLETNNLQAAAQLKSVEIQAQQVELTRQMAGDQKRLLVKQERTTNVIAAQTRFLKSRWAMPEPEEEEASAESEP